MFAVIYRSYLIPGSETNYKKHWHKIARYFVEQRSAIGSTLHQTEEGLWVAYSRWPDKATRDASWNAICDDLKTKSPGVTPGLFQQNYYYL
jgi:hypothetical protein